jgi:uroporphyrinogen decarboxylase
MRADSRECIKQLVEGRSLSRVPWTLDFGSCKGMQPSLLEEYRANAGVTGSLASNFDYDIWIALDPDRVHYDNLPHLDSGVKKRIQASALHGGIPLSNDERYDYRRHYGALPEGGFFDGFGLYYHPWPDNPDYYRFLSPLESVGDRKTIDEYPAPTLRPEDILSFQKDVEYIRSRGKMCAAYSGSFYEWSYYLRGRERIYFDYHDNPGLVDLLVEKVAGFTARLTEKNIECGVDILCFYDDLGDQKSLQISPSTFRRFYKPLYKRIWGSIKERFPGRYIFLHACGNVAELIPDFIECGLDILHPIQPEAMDIFQLAREYSDRLVFWGTMSNQKTLSLGTEREIYEEVRNRVDEIGKYGNLILGPANTLGRDVPVDNIQYFKDACVRLCSRRR